MADFSGSKQQFCDQMIATCRSLLQLAEDLQALNASFNVHGFNDGGANEFVDADFATSNKHLIASFVFDAMFAIGTIDNALTTGVKNSLREVIPGGIP